MSTVLRNVVYTGTYSLEHWMEEGAATTLCKKKPGHINPTPVVVLPDRFHRDYCTLCYSRGRQLLGQGS